MIKIVASHNGVGLEHFQHDFDLHDDNGQDDDGFRNQVGHVDAAAVVDRPCLLLVEDDGQLRNPCQCLTTTICTFSSWRNDSSRLPNFSTCYLLALSSSTEDVLLISMATNLPMLPSSMKRIM